MPGVTNWCLAAGWAGGAGGAEMSEMFHNVEFCGIPGWIFLKTEADSMQNDETWKNPLAIHGSVLMGG